MINLKEVEERCEKATKGPWFTDKPAIDPETGFRDGVMIAGTMGRQGIYANPPGGQAPWADCQFIAHSRTDLPEAIRLLREAREKAASMLHTCTHHPALECQACNWAGWLGEVRDE